MSETLPVVECVVTRERVTREWTVSEAYDVVYDGELLAYAVPVALLEDVAFMQTVMKRTSGYFVDGTCADKPFGMEFMAALTAELRERAEANQ